MDIIAVTTTAQAQSFLDMVQIIYQQDGHLAFQNEENKIS